MYVYIRMAHRTHAGRSVSQTLHVLPPECAGPNDDDDADADDDDDDTV